MTVLLLAALAVSAAAQMPEPPRFSTAPASAPFSMLQRRTPLVSPGPALSGLESLSSSGFDGGREPRTWTWRLSMGPTRTSYYSTPLKIRTSEVRLDISKVDIRERHTLHMYRVWEDANPFQFIDEPSNTFLLSAENNKRRYAVNLLVQHPKFLLTGEGLNTRTRAVGEVEGQRVDSYGFDLNSLYGDYRVTANHYLAYLGVEKIVPIVSGKLGALTYQPGLYGGIHLGYSQAVYKGRSYAAPLGVIGYGAQLDNRLVYHFPNDRVTAALGYHLHSSQLKYPFIDGTAEQDLSYQALSFNLGCRLTPKTKRTGR